jgi:hypothetical protein
MFDGKKTLEEIVDSSGEDEIETLQQIAKLYGVGLLEEKPAGGEGTSVV